ncbi:MAG: hypothetical protein IJJ86_02860 [Clostridia bacterium]|nr:hypothetical protein [Clostridia bacterium]
MAYQTATLPSFSGVRMDLCDGLLKADMSPDAYNADTRAGSLRSAGGFSRVVPETIDADAPFVRTYVYATDGGDQYLAASENALYRYDTAHGLWRTVYLFERDIDGAETDFLKVRIGTDDRLLISTGREPMLTLAPDAFAVESFGTAAKGSNKKTRYTELYFGRLFAAGDPDAPCRLYWSKAPGSGRTIDDWRADPASENVSGGFADVGVDDDPITGLFALSNQLLIFKRDSLYRLLGDRPSNYRIVAVDASFRQPKHTACVRYADRLFFLTDGGLYFYDGQTVRRSPAFRALEPLLKASDLSEARAAACGDVLYFALRSRASLPYDDLVVEYDVLRDRYMVRKGMRIADLCALHGVLYALTDDGRLVAFDENSRYDGDPINVKWQTPRLDLGRKDVKKTLLSLTASGSGRIAVRVQSDGGCYDTVARFSNVPDGVTEIPLRGEGRVFRLTFSSVDGGPFEIDAPVTLLFDQQRRP